MYGAKPIDLGSFYVPEKFGTYILYMPVLMPGSECRLPEGLKELEEVIYTSFLNYGWSYDKYVYLSYECSYVKAGITQKRPGYHSDGFLTDDINFLWHSNTPTIFSKTQFKVDTNHNVSMEQFEQQAKPEDEFTMPNGHLLKLNQYVIHKAAVPTVDSVRTFVKISISNDMYNLKENTHNPLFDYNWKMYDRNQVRNHPQIKEVDSVPEGKL